MAQRLNTPHGQQLTVLKGRCWESGGGEGASPGRSWQERPGAGRGGARGGGAQVKKVKDGLGRKMVGNPNPQHLNLQAAGPLLPLLSAP